MTVNEKKKRLEKYRIGIKELKRFEKEYSGVLRLSAVVPMDTKNEEIRLCQRVSTLLKDKRNIENKINTLDNATQALLLKYRYIDGYKWEEICDLLDYSPRSIHYIHNKALNSIAM